MKKLSILFIAFIILSSCNRNMMKVPCDDERKVILAKENPLIQIYNSELQKNLQTSIKVSDFFEANPKYEKIEKIQQNFEMLNQISTTYWLSLLTLSENRRTDPCDKQLANDLKDQVERMHEKIVELEKIRLNIDRILNESGIGGSSFEIINLEIEKLIRTYK